MSHCFLVQVGGGTREKVPGARSYLPFVMTRDKPPASTEQDLLSQISQFDVCSLSFHLALSDALRKKKYYYQVNSTCYKIFLPFLSSDLTLEL